MGKTIGVIRNTVLFKIPFKRNFFFLSNFDFLRCVYVSECTLRILYESSYHNGIYENVQSSCLQNQLAPPTYAL